MRISRIARPCAIYDASAAAQTFSDGELFDISGRGGEFLENGETEVRRNGRKNDFEQMPCFLNLRENDKMMLIK